jgi:hypothetical protein
MFAGMAQTEPNPPLYWLLLRGWMRLAGEGELAVRLPSVLAGLLVVALTYRLARALLPRGVRGPGAQVAAFLAAINPFLIWHARDARVYSLLAALVTAAAWLTLRAATRGPTVRAYLSATVLWWLALMAHYFAFFALAAVCAAALSLPPGRRGWKPGLAALAALALAYLPWALYAGPLLLSHTKDWIKPISLAGGFERTLIAFTGGLLLDQPQAAVAALAGGALALAGTAILIGDRSSAAPISNSKFSIPWLAWGPPLLLGLLSLWRPAFDERFVITALPAVLILIAVPLARWWRAPRLLAGLLVVLLAGLALRSLGNYYFNPAFAKSPDWRGLAAYLADSASPQDVILQDFEDPAFGYYYRGPTPVEDSPPDSSVDQEARLRALLEAHPRLWFFLSDATTAGADWLDEHAERLSDGRVHGFRLQVFDSPAGSLAARLPFEGRFAGGVRLIGYRLFPPTDGEGFEGGPLHLTLYWQAAEAVGQDYTVFTHFVAADGYRVAGHDSPPARGRRPTTGWTPGETIVDPHDLAIPADLAPGEYFIRVGLYDPATGQRLPVVDSSDDFVTLPVSVEVAAP